MQKKIRKTNLKKQFNLKTQEAKVSNETFVYTGPMSVADFAKKTNIDSSTIIKHFFLKGAMINLNALLNDDQIGEICIENNLDFRKEKDISDESFIEDLITKDDAKELVTRAPIVTVMGHVDHGKTTLIDYIRKSNIVASEKGGITQQTGAYQITYKDKKITMIDTPGHEAFTEMRLRGSKVTDIVILVVAADDGVMPQTREAIDHAKVAKVPVIVFVNKIDKVSAVDKNALYNAISTAGLTPDEWGGDTMFVYGSALKGLGMNELFDAILLQSELLDLKANPNRLAIGTIIESTIDKTRGVISTLIVLNGTLRKRDFIVAGSNYGRIRQMLDSNDKSLDAATPGTPVFITGLNYSPEPGSKFIGFEDEKFAKNFAEKRGFFHKQKELQEKSAWKTNLSDSKILNIVVKTNVNGTAEAIKDSLNKIKNDEVQVKIVRASAGPINKSDLLLAEASGAIIYGFNVRPTTAIRSLAKDQNIEIRTHSIIYKLIEEVQDIVKGMLAPKYEEKILGSANILKVIYSSKVGNIAGSKVDSGKMQVNSKARLIRNGVVVYDGVIDSLQRGADSVREVVSGLECGIVIKNYNDIKQDDVIESYTSVKVEN